MQSNSLSHEERNRIALVLLEGATPLIRKYAAAYRLDFEETYQDMSIVIMRLLDAGIDGIHNLPAYVTLRVRSRIINLLHSADRHRCRTVSLDAQLASEDGDGCTLADLLAAPDRWEPLANLTAQECIQELSPMLAQPMNASHRRAIRERWETAAASCEVSL